MGADKAALMRRLREERRKQGLKPIEVWAPPEVHDRIRKYAKRLTAEKAAQ